MKEAFDSDQLVDEASVIDKVGDVLDCYQQSHGKVTKEIVEVGTGKEKPVLGSLCRIKYIAYFYDKEMFDLTPEGQTIDLYLGDIQSIEGLWRGIQEMREGEKAKLRIKSKYAFGRPGEVDQLKFPAAYATGDRREKLVSKAVIYEVELVKFIKRVDIDGNGSIFK